MAFGKVLSRGACCKGEEGCLLLGCFSVSVRIYVYPFILSSEQRSFFMYPMIRCQNWFSWSDRKARGNPLPQKTAFPRLSRSVCENRKDRRRPTRQAAAAARKAKRPQPTRPIDDFASKLKGCNCWGGFFFPKAQINQISQKQIIQVARATEACQMHSYTRKMLCPVQQILQATPPFWQVRGGTSHNLTSGAIHFGLFDTWILMPALFKARLPKQEHKFTGMQCFAEPCQMRIRQNIEEETWHRIYRKNEMQHFVNNLTIFLYMYIYIIYILS